MLAEDVRERVQDVSADLPYELQSKMFDQLATVSIAGAGLAVTLIGGVLERADPMVWISVLFFALGGQMAVSGNLKLIEGLFRKRPVLRRSKIDITLTITMIGAAIGMLTMGIYSDGKRPSKAPPAATSAKR